MKRVAVVIVTYNSEKDIFDCVASIRSHSDIALEDIELIIVDNNSINSEPMFERLRRQWGEDIICIRNTHNGGYGQGNNIGIRRSTAPVILIMNPDVRLICPIFKKALELFDKDRLLVMYGMKQMLTETKPSNGSIICTYRMNGYLRTLLNMAASRLDFYLPQLMFFSGSCFFVKREPFMSIGLFDEEVFLYGEEEDIHYRLRKRFKCHFKYDPSLRYLHLTNERKPSLKHEMAIVDVAMRQNAKKGYPAKKTLRNIIQKNNLQLASERTKLLVGKGDSALYQLFLDLRKELMEVKKGMIS